MAVGTFHDCKLIDSNLVTNASVTSATSSNRARRNVWIVDRWYLLGEIDEWGEEKVGDCGVVTDILGVTKKTCNYFQGIIISPPYGVPIKLSTHTNMCLQIFCKFVCEKM